MKPVEFLIHFDRASDLSLQQTVTAITSLAGQGKRHPRLQLKLALDTSCRCDGHEISK